MILGALELRFKLVGASGREAGFVLFAAAGDNDNGVVLRLQVDRLEVTGRELRNEFAVGRSLLFLPAGDQALREKCEHDHDQDWEGCALEETAH